MKYLEIANDGLLDVRLIALMGGSTKSEDVHKIGQFGTGLKYVLAYVFRNKIGFKIFVGEREVEIKTEVENIQGTDFEIIYIDGEKTSVTTNMGRDWKPWMIVRELYSNALDEGGEYYGISQAEEGQVGKTTFQIELTPDFAKVFNDWNKYFIVDHVPIFENNQIAVYARGGNLRLYKHGILILQQESDSLFNYDIKNAPLNELREYLGTAESAVVAALKQLDQPTIEYLLENVKDSDYEGKLDYKYYDYTDFGKAWKEAIGTAKIIHKKAVADITARELDIDLSSVIQVPIKLYSALTKQFEGVGALRVAKEIGDFYEILSPELEEKLKRALLVLETCGYFMDANAKYVFGAFGNGPTLARANLSTHEIWISEKMSGSSMFQFVAMLIEENEHLKTEMSDCSRQFQQHFIDLYTKSMLDLNKVEL